MKKLLTGLLIATLGLSLAGCSETDESGNIHAKKDGLSRWAYVQDLPDGRSVICAGGPSALSCDWANAK